MRHAFLLLAALFLVPGALVWFGRPDLRRLIVRMALASLPFAATERLFYPAYWTPHFLFDLADRIGFGIEDVLFVVGLAAFSSTAYAVVSRRTPRPRAPHGLAPYAARGRARGMAAARAVGAIVLALAAAVGLWGAGMPIVYAAVLAMVGVTLVILARRPDLVLPSVLGAALSAGIYLALCLVFAALVPGVFESTWRPSVLLPGVRIASVPLDEVLYGLGAGFAATAFPAWAFDFVYDVLPSMRPSRCAPSRPR